MGLINKMIFSKTIMPAINKSLMATNMRSRAIADNIANISTEGYKRKEVSFESKLNNKLFKTSLSGVKTNDKHINIGRNSLKNITPTVYRSNDKNLYSGVNSVDIDTEMAKMADNEILHNFDVKFLSLQYQKLNKAIKGRVG